MRQLAVLLERSSNRSGGVGGLLALGIVPRLQQHATLSVRQHEGDEGRVSVTVVRPERAPAATEFVLPGNIQAIEETALYARVNGYLHERFVDIGTRVRAGQVLAVIETPELAQELAQELAAKYPEGDWKPRALELNFALQQNIPIYGQGGISSTK